jgi:hypothetical protein
MSVRERPLQLLAVLLAAGLAICTLPTTTAAGRLAKSPDPCSKGLGIFSANPTTAPLSEPLDQMVSASFAVLRRPGRAEDQVPPINPLAEDLAYQLRSYFPAEIRLLATDAEGESYFVIPGFARVFPTPPERCLPRQERHRRAQLVAEQHKQESEPMYCIEDVGPHRPRYGGSSCLPFSAIQSGEKLVTSAASRSDVLDMAPDGVATVRLIYRSGAVINAAVTNNAYSFTPPQQPIKAALKALKRFGSSPSQLIRRHLTERQRTALVRAFFKRVEALGAPLVAETVQWLDLAGNPIRSFTPRTQNRGEGLLGLLLAGEGSAALGSLAISSG